MHQVLVKLSFKALTDSNELLNIENDKLEFQNFENFKLFYKLRAISRYLILTLRDFFKGKDRKCETEGKL